MSIHIKKTHEGLLHKKLHVPLGQKLTMAEIKKAEHSRSAPERAEGDFAAAARRWK
jgi:hypothetical protein